MRLFPHHDRPPEGGGGAARPRRRGLRYAAAAAIAVGGYIHLCLYRNGFRAVPKIGTGFLLQVVTSAVLAGGHASPASCVSRREHDQ